MRFAATSRVPGLLVSLAFAAVASAGPHGARAAADADRPFTGLAFLGSAVLPRDLEVDGTRVGGLSGLAWDAASARFWAISDDRGEFGPARIYRLRIEVGAPAASSASTPVAVTVDRMLPLRTLKGRRYSPGTIDPEGIALLPDGFFISTESIVRRGVQTAIGEYAWDGRLRREVRLPAHYTTSPGHGVRDNLGFEGLGLTRDGRYLFAGLENALAQDGPVADFGVPSPARILRVDRRNGGAQAEFAYLVDAVPGAAPAAKTSRANGLSDLLPLDATHLLVLERSWVEGLGNSARIYEVSLDGATDVSGLESLAGASLVPARKTLLADLAGSGVPLDNFEGMSFGPDLPDGRGTLVLVSDDNFNPSQAPPTFLVFAVDRSPMTVARIQGTSHRSPLDGSWVFRVPGVVTAVDRDPRNTGFYLESTRPDGDPATSEGIFVLWPGPASLAPGQAVSVYGRVDEIAQSKSLPVTRLKATAVVPLEGEPALPPPVKLFEKRPMPPVIHRGELGKLDPEGGALDLWESLEGMRVEVPAGTVVGPTSERGDLVLRPDGAPPVPRTAAGGVLLQEEGPSLDRVVLGRKLAGAMPEADVGARLRGPITGVVDYSFGTYRVLPLAPPAVESPGKGCDATTALAGDSEHVTLATWNVENLSVAGPPARFARLGDVIARRLKNPDLLALEEVQDDSGPAGRNDGVVTSRKTLDALVSAIAAAGGPAYEAVWIDPVEGKEGGQPGGNIRVALLVNPARLALVRRGEAGPLDATQPEGAAAGLHLTLSPGRVAPRSTAFSPTEGEGVRRSLAAELRFGGKTLFVVANHWSSKSDDDRAFGPTQPPRTPTVSRRVAQAREIRAFVDRLLAADPGARVAALGDLNDFEHSEAVRLLAAPPLEDLLMRVPAASRYTFNFEGASQVLDHVVVSPALARDAEVEVLHVDSDCADAKRASDHDPVLTRLAVR